jgi:hypothetical protein
VSDLDKLAKLIDTLAKLTQIHKIAWSETADEDTFQTSFPQYNVSVTKKYAGQNWGEDYYEYRITVRDQTGKVLEDAGHSDFRGVESLGGGTAESMMKSLYDNARRSALKVDEALSDLLSSLDHLK